MQAPFVLPSSREEAGQLPWPLAVGWGSLILALVGPICADHGRAFWDWKQVGSALSAG